MNEHTSYVLMIKKHTIKRHAFMKTDLWTLYEKAPLRQ